MEANLRRAIDVTMLALLNATERDAKRWRELFEEADKRFVVEDIKVVPPGIMAIIEVGWKA